MYIFFIENFHSESIPDINPDSILDANLSQE